MFGLTFSELLSCLAIGGGIILVAYALFQKSKKENILKNGEKAEGIVFETEYRRHTSMIGRGQGPYDPKDNITIRFVTKDQQWITAKLDDAFVFYYTGQYKIGDKVNVIYNPSNPYEFAVTTGQSESLARVLFATIGAALFLVGAYSLFFKSST